MMRHMPSLDPVEIEDLARALRDGEPRELKVVGRRVIEHATVTGIIIRRDGEHVELEQPGRSAFTVDAEDLMWMRSSALTPDIVQPWLSAVDPVAPTTTEAETEVAPQVLATIGFVRGVKPDQIIYTRSRTHDGNCAARYDALRLLYEMTDLSKIGMPKLIGYGSPTPLWTALQETRKDVQRITDLVTLVRERSGHCWRRSTERDACIVD